MYTTPPSLLSRVRDPGDHAAWAEFDLRYREWLVRFFRGRGVPFADAEDLTQRVFAGLMRSLPQFTYDPNRGRFRNYLFRCARNALSLWANCPERKDRPLDFNGDTLVSAECDDPALLQAWEEEWVAHHCRAALAALQNSASQRDLHILKRSMAGASMAELVAELGMGEEAVFKARQRIRQKMERLIAQQVADEDRVDA